MDEAGLALLVETGKELYSTKLYITAIHFLWIYDYFLTLGDEIECAWNGRRSWVFALFIANRYSPVPHIIWSSALLYDYSDSFCQATKWLGFTHAAIVCILAEITIALRIYAVTERNKWIGGALSSVIAMQLAFGIHAIVSVAVTPTEELPEINLDPFKFCLYNTSRFDDLLPTNIGVVFDILAFLIIVVTAKKRRPRYPGMPSILDAILQDATHYFILIFSCQVLSDFFVFFAPKSLALSPGIATTVLIPLMSSRLMLSLKKASVESNRVRSLPTSTNPPASRSLRFVSQAPGGLPEAPGIPPRPSFVEEVVELESVSRPSMEDNLSLSRW